MPHGLLHGLGVFDAVAVAMFALAWLAYHVITEHSALAARSLNTVMNGERRAWISEALQRENRIFDAQIMASLQNGAAFFTSTALFAIGGALALLPAGDTVSRLLADVSMADPPTRAAFEIKTLGLAVIFIYGFFKFAWAYRLFNYAAILLGSLPSAPRMDMPDTAAGAARTAEMLVAAGTQFNRGQRAFFFALAYLGWFVGPVVLLVATALALAVMALRQFSSPARRAVQLGRPHA